MIEVQSHADVARNLTELLETQRFEPGYIPEGPAEFVGSLPVMRALTGNPDVVSPADIPASVMPESVSWGLMTVLDEATEQGRFDGVVALAHIYRMGFAGNDDLWKSVNGVTLEHTLAYTFDPLMKLFGGFDYEPVERMVEHYEAFRKAVRNVDLNGAATAGSAMLNVSINDFFMTIHKMDPNEIEAPGIVSYSSIENMWNASRKSVLFASSGMISGPKIRQAILNADFLGLIVNSYLNDRVPTAPDQTIYTYLERPVFEHLVETCGPDPRALIRRASGATPSP